MSCHHRFTAVGVLGQRQGGLRHYDLHSGTQVRCLSPPPPRHPPPAAALLHIITRVDSRSPGPGTDVDRLCHDCWLAELRVCAAPPLLRQPVSAEHDAEFTTDQLDAAYFGRDGDPDAGPSTADGIAGEVDDDASEEDGEALALSEAEHLFTVPDFLDSAEELRQHFDDRCQPVAHCCEVEFKVRSDKIVHKCCVWSIVNT